MPVRFLAGQTLSALRSEFPCRLPLKCFPEQSCMTDSQHFRVFPVMEMKKSLAQESWQVLRWKDGTFPQGKVSQSLIRMLLLRVQLPFLTGRCRLHVLHAMP